MSRGKHRRGTPRFDYYDLDPSEKPWFPSLWVEGDCSERFNIPESDQVGPCVGMWLEMCPSCNSALFLGTGAGFLQGRDEHATSQ